MALLLILHDLGAPPQAAEEDFFYTLFGVAPAHWRVTPAASLVGTDLSPRYLLQHLRDTARRCAIQPRVLMVMPVPADIAAYGLGADGEAWMRDMRD